MASLCGAIAAGPASALEPASTSGSRPASELTPESGARLGFVLPSALGTELSSAPASRAARPSADASVGSSTEPPPLVNVRSSIAHAGKAAMNDDKTVTAASCHAPFFVMVSSGTRAVRGQVCLGTGEAGP
jgi:hypothetical protein